MEIRYIDSSDDRRAISRIYEESWRHAYRGIVPQDYLNSIPEGRWERNFDIPGWRTMVCVENGEYVGTSSFCRSRFERYPDSGEVISIYLLPEHTGKGYGAKLLEAVLNELKSRALMRPSSGCLKKTSGQDGFMKRTGFPFLASILTPRSEGKNCGSSDTSENFDLIPRERY